MDHDETTDETTDVTVGDDGIRLGQLLKYADVVDSGAEVKSLLADGEVAVNGEEETRRGRQLFAGDVVRVGDRRILLRAGDGD